MSRDDWYRNTTWNPQIEEAFFTKLRRARDKSQYLRIQACCLTETEPKIALKLLEEFFNLGQHFDKAQAHVDEATAHIVLNDIDQAISAFKAALAREKEYPQLLTLAYLEYPLLVVTRQLTSQYQEVLAVLEENESRPTFPIDHFLWNGISAVLHNELGNSVGAQMNASVALEAAAKDSSGFRYHPRLGLVTGKHASLRHLLESIAA